MKKIVCIILAISITLTAGTSFTSVFASTASEVTEALNDIKSIYDGKYWHAYLQEETLKNAVANGYAARNYIYLPSETKVGTVNIPSSCDNLSIRTGTSTDYQIIGSMNSGDKCTILTDKTKNNWYFIEFNGIYGYASGSCIDD